MSGSSAASFVDPVDLNVESRGQKKSVGRFWHLVVRSTRLVCRAGFALFIALVTLQIAAAATLALQVVVVERLLNAILALGSGDSPSALVVPVLLLAALTATNALVGTLRGNLGRYLAEAVARRTWWSRHRPTRRPRRR